MKECGVLATNVASGFVLATCKARVQGDARYRSLPLLSLYLFKSYFLLRCGVWAAVRESNK